MSLREELGLDQPIETIEHECLLNIVYTGTIFSKLSYKFFSKSEITDAQFNVLMQLKYSKQQKLSQVDLSKRLFVNRADITGLIDRLEKGGFVKRGSHPTDRRVNLIAITSIGLELLSRLEPEYFKEVNKIFGNFGKKEINDLISSLEKIRKQAVLK
ncbi:MAG: MarR family transcriptional regulator [bacterium]|nr:MarR family transcriptional regulator [bacterium]